MQYREQTPDRTYVILFILGALVTRAEARKLGPRPCNEFTPNIKTTTMANQLIPNLR